ncbi:MAG: lysophospholipid acyltransferase family protein [Phycisphaerae bacterium]|nr:lysophospholipid acyltransferase family protein [Planctomycetota bacterium]MBL7220562.1 lysophospholipid acyltransferase family protein [Phycisphaerae bacterium]
MKLSHPIAIKTAALLGSWVLRLWLNTADYWFCFEDPQSDPHRTRRRNIYLFWHEVMLFPLITHCGPDFSILVSRHRDGELITQVMRMFQGKTVRGSTSRGAAAGLLGMMRNQPSKHLGITPDGPRGPRRVVQDGAIYLASRTAMPLVPAGCAFDGCRRAGSWDKMALPRPFRRAVGVVGSGLIVPGDLDREGIEACREKVQEEMDRVQARAEQLAAAGKIDTCLEPARRVLDASLVADRRR